MDPTIVVVEDHTDTREMFRYLLEREGYRVFEAEDAEKGIRVTREQLPDLVLMDLSLPGMNGTCAVLELKTGATTRDIPVVALTAHAGDDVRDRALAAGFDLFLTKPCHPNVVLGALRTLLPRPQATTDRLAIPPYVGGHQVAARAPALRAFA